MTILYGHSPAIFSKYFHSKSLLGTGPGPRVVKFLKYDQDNRPGWIIGQPAASAACPPADDGIVPASCWMLAWSDQSQARGQMGRRGTNYPPGISPLSCLPSLSSLCSHDERWLSGGQAPCVVPRPPHFLRPDDKQFWGIQSPPSFSQSSLHLDDLSKNLGGQFFILPSSKNLKPNKINWLWLSKCICLIDTR